MLIYVREAWIDMLKYENVYEDCKHLQSVESFVKVYVTVAVTLTLI